MQADVSNQKPSTALLLLMGLPGCGKTTLCKSLCRTTLSRLANSNNDVIGFSHLEFDEFLPDSVVSASVNLEDVATWKQIRHCLLKSLDKLLFRLTNNAAKLYFTTAEDKSDEVEPDLTSLTEPLLNATASAGRVILLDDNFYYFSMRHSVLQLARHYNCGFGTVYLKASLAQLKLVNAVRDKPVPNGVLDRMWDRLEAPNPERNAWEKYNCVLGQSDLGFLDDVGHYSDNSVNGRLHALIRDCLANPFEPLPDPEVAEKLAEEARETCSMSLLHQADLRLRAIVADWLAARPDQLGDSEKAELGKSAAASKRAVMNALTSGKLKVPAQFNTAFSPDKRDALDKFLIENIKLPE